MKNAQRGFAPILLLIVAVIVIGGGVYYYSTIRSVVPETINNLETSNTNSPIKLLSTEIPASASTAIKGSIQYDCQPEGFDPKITKYTKEQTVGVPTELYKIEGEETTSMQIDGWNKEGENKLSLAAPYKLTKYVFGCASNFSSVAEITKNGTRQALFTHIENWLSQSSVSQDKKHIFIANNVKTSNGTWETMRRIVNVETNAEVKLPNMSCVSNDGFWSGNKLITTTNYFESINPGDTTQVCVWSTDGKLLNQIEAELYWHGANDLGLMDQIGVLPSDPNIFYTYSHLSSGYPKTGDVCYLHLQDMTNPSRYKRIKIAEVNEEMLSCPKVTFNFQGVTFDSQKVPFEINKNQN